MAHCVADMSLQRFNGPPCRRYDIGRVSRTWTRVASHHAFQIHHADDRQRRLSPGAFVYRDSTNCPSLYSQSIRRVPSSRAARVIDSIDGAIDGRTDGRTPPDVRTRRARQLAFNDASPTTVACFFCHHDLSSPPPPRS